MPKFGTITRRLATRGTVPPPYAGYGGYGNAVGTYNDPRLPSSAKDWASEAGDLALNTVVAACLGWMQDNFATARLTVNRRIDRRTVEPVDDHEILELLGPSGKPNPDYSLRAFWSAMLRSYKCDGNAYAILGRDLGGMGSPRALWWEPPGNVFPWRDPSSERLVDCYYILRPGGISRLDPSQVLHLRDGIDPYSPMKGLARLKAALRCLVGLNRAETFTAAIIGNGGIKKVWVPDEGMDVDDATALGIQKRFAMTRGENSGSIAVANSPGHFEDAGSGPQELAMDTLLDRPEASVCAMLGVQAMSVGLAVGANQRTFSNMKEADAMSWRNGLIPTQDGMAEDSGDQLFGQWGEDATGLELAWDRSEVAALQEDKTEKINRAVVAFQAELCSKGTAQMLADLPITDAAGDEWYQAPAPVAPGQDPADEENDHENA